MALTDGNGSDMVMPVAPMYGGGNGGFGNGFGGDWAWIILLLLLGWGNGGWGNGGFGGGNELYPWMNQAEITSDGFRDQMMNTNITSIRDSIGDISTQLCNGFAGVEQGANARQIANMQQAFASQTAMTQGFNSLASQFADCCCENRLANCQTQNIIQSEASATRFADANNTRDLLTNQTANTQAILDKLCQLELDAKNDKISDLERQLTMANMQASQAAQTATLQLGQTAEVDALYQRLKDCPVPTMPVYGMTPIFTCNSGCGCGNNF